MNVYVIYKFSDSDKVRKKVNEIKEAINNDKGTYSNKVSFFMFPNNVKKKFWHREARKKIKKCNLVAFFDYFDDDVTDGWKNIKWELNCAEKYKKRIVVFKKNRRSFVHKIYETDYSDIEINRLRYKIRDMNEALDFFMGEVNWRMDNNLIRFSSATSSQSTASNEDKQLLLDQYRIMIDTSEKLMERRQAVGSLYTTICTALIAFVGASFGFSNFFVPAIATLMSGIIIIVLCYNWRSSLHSYDLNNEGKFAVINEIEKHLPADMFDCEYRYNTLNGIRSYSAREKILPLIFAMFGGVMILMSVALFLIQYFSL